MSYVAFIQDAGRRLVREERGMTLAELLSAQIVAAVVLAAAGMLVVVSIKQEQRVSDKVNSISQGRIIAAQIEQRLNSQMCLYPGEYKINGATQGTAAASILYAGSDKVIYFADISERPSGSTTGVGFQPNLRYLLAPTASDGRSGGFLDAYRAPSTSTLPFNFGVTPATSLDDLATPSIAANVPPTSILRRMGVGVTNATTGTTGATVPYFQYWDSNNLGPTGVPITLSNGAVPINQINTIGRIRVSFRILGQSGKDSATGSTSARRLDDRTESLSSDIYLRTTPDVCDQLGS